MLLLRNDIKRNINASLAFIRIGKALIKKVIKKFKLKKTRQDVVETKYNFETQVKLHHFLNDAVFGQNNNKFCIHMSTKQLGCKNFDAVKFLDYMKKKCADGILLIPAFTMEGTQYSSLKTKKCIIHETVKIKTGVISKIAASDPDFRLVLHPTHSYLVLRTKLISNQTFKNYNGITTDNSPLKFLEINGGKVLNLGVGLNQTTFIHCIEEENKIFPLQTLARPIDGQCSSNEKSLKRSFCIRPLKPLLFHIRDCDAVKQELINCGSLYEFKHNNARIQTIKMHQMRKNLQVLANKGHTIYGKFHLTMEDELKP